MLKIREEIEESSAVLLSAPHNTPIGRPDETKAVKDAIVTLSV